MPPVSKERSAKGICLFDAVPHNDSVLGVFFANDIEYTRAIMASMAVKHLDGNMSDAKGTSGKGPYMKMFDLQLLHVCAP
jgi:hypothetical protein